MIKYFVLCICPFLLSAGIVDEDLHRQNCATIRSLIDQPVSAQALKGKFSLDAYDLTDPLRFEMIPLCDGDQTRPSLFLYLWPAEPTAKSAGSQYHLSNVHSHPLPCAFAVLDGEVTERLFEEISPGRVRCIAEKTFSRGEGDVDDTSAPFIHQMVARTGPAATLHAYGAPTCADVQRIFSETYAECRYLEVVGEPPRTW